MSYVGYSEPYPGSRGDTFMRRGGRPGQHRGSDTAPGGVHAISAADGRIAAKLFTAALGNIVVISFDDGKYMGIAHLATQSAFPTGARVTRGNSVGAFIGNTGTASSGRHMHYTIGDDPRGIISGHVQDPIAWFEDHPARGVVTPASGGSTPFNPPTSSPSTPIEDQKDEDMITAISTHVTPSRIDHFGQEFVHHSGSVVKSQFVANIETVGDKFITIENSGQLDAILDARGIPYNDYIKLAAGKSWSRAAINTELLNRLVKR